jgi:hypothetical protein
MAFLAVACMMLLAACSSQPSRQPAIGTAYVGPTSLNLRADLELRAETTATVFHGDRLDILDTRRKFVKVRTESGAEGWTDSGDLLTQSQMDDLNGLAEYAGAMPSLGGATVFDTLNVHTGPSRAAPSFVQLQESEPIDVVGHRVTPRDNDPSASDDWFLVRMPDRKAGWVLTRMVLMNIPEEVAQYAEGHFIMSYHALGEVRDDESGEIKKNWLWTTSARLNRPYDFDSFRVFVYSARRHRYETAYIERNVTGYYPVQAAQAADGSWTFSLAAEDKDGGVYRRTYSFADSRVRLLTKEPFRAQGAAPDVRPADAFDRHSDDAEDKSWRGRLKRAAEYWFGF